MPPLRTFLALGRACNLPTVWSNCLAGWWLGGGGPLEKLPFLIVGATLCYFGGAFVNDAWDTAYDSQHRRNRPIPSGEISGGSVAILGGVLLLLGVASLSVLGLYTAIFALLLAGSILLFDAIHRVVTISGVLLGACRFWLYVTAASTGVDGVTGWAIWGGLAMAIYVTGLAGFGGKRKPDFPQALLLFVPIGLAMVMNVGHFREAGLLLSAVLGLWVIRCLRYTFWSSESDFARTRAGLVAGIIFVDWLALADAPKELSIALIALFLVTLTFQRMAEAGAR